MIIVSPAGAARSHARGITPLRGLTGVWGILASINIALLWSSARPLRLGRRNFGSRDGPTKRLHLAAARAFPSQLCLNFIAVSALPVRDANGVSHTSPGQRPGLISQR